MKNKLGHYDKERREYVINLANDDITPRPWSNIITNKNFGTLITCSGASFTWFLNSALFRLTPWVNDVVLEKSGESVLLMDKTTGDTWSPMLQAAREKEPYEIRHGLGYTTFEHTSHKLLQKVRVFVHPEEPIKYIEISLKNLSRVPRKISLSYSCQWILGDFLENTTHFLWTGMTPNKDSLVAKVLVDDFRSGYTAYLRCTDNKTIELDGATITKTINLPASGEATTTFCLGIIKDGENHNVPPSLAFDKSQDFWQEITSSVSVTTPDADLNNLFNDRLIYQALSSRLWGRTGMYQPGGAYGFRDQLQDSLAFIWSKPYLTREHILKTAHQQYLSGDVLQWWHPPTNFGSISISSDSHLWLVYATCKYWQITGDDSILDEVIPYLNNQENKQGTLYEHCLVSIEKTLTALGSHGLPLMLGGDWNDSLDEIGKNGRGESVWLSLFLSFVLTEFSQICELKNDRNKANNFIDISKKQVEIVEKIAWNDSWFIRAFDDDGKTVEFIDSIVQSWSVICNLVNKDLSQTAMNSVISKLVDRKNQIIKLLTPPISAETVPYLGYIQQYPPGIRENGGFYCHAAVWVAWAFAKQGDGNSAKEIIDMINPLKRTSTQEGIDCYMVEPYVLSSDIDSSGANIGRGGWSWYTGSAATLYIVLMEEIFGLKLQKNLLTLDPCLPREWKEISIKYRYQATTYQININNPNSVNRGVKEIFLDGQKQASNQIILLNDSATHRVEVYLCA